MQCKQTALLLLFTLCLHFVSSEVKKQLFIGFVDSYVSVATEFSARLDRQEMLVSVIYRKYIIYNDVIYYKFNLKLHHNYVILCFLPSNVCRTHLV